MVLHSNSFVAIAWWFGYSILAIWAQRYIPGVDFLIPGLLLSLQRQSGFGTAWLLFAWVFLQEGMGSLPFGYGLAWYGLAVVLYIAGRWLFEARSILFVCLLGLTLGALHPLLISTLCSLANMSIVLQPVILDGVFQAILFPVIWILADHMFPKRLKTNVRFI